MTEPTLTFELGRSRAGFVQRIADQWVWSTLALGAGSRPLPRPALAPRGRGGAWREVVSAAGEVEGREHRVRVERNSRGDRRVGFEDGERFWVGRDGERIVRLARDGAGIGRARLVERALGAPLALALAIRGVHLLHASAVAGPAGVVALLGAAGAGKSTLASAAAASPGLGLERVADDILPVRLGAVPRALPSYPQLKVEGTAPVWPEERPAALPLAGLVELVRGESGTALELVPLPLAQAVPVLARATVAARLFDGELLAAHFETSATVALHLPVWKLYYPGGRAGLRGALGALARAGRT